MKTLPAPAQKTATLKGKALQRYVEVNAEISKLKKEHDALKEVIEAEYPEGDTYIGDFHVAITPYDRFTLDREALVAKYGEKAIDACERATPCMRVSVKKVR